MIVEALWMKRRILESLKSSNMSPEHCKSINSKPFTYTSLLYFQTRPANSRQYESIRHLHSIYFLAYSHLKLVPFASTLPFGCLSLVLALTSFTVMVFHAHRASHRTWCQPSGLVLSQMLRKRDRLVTGA